MNYYIKAKNEWTYLSQFYTEAQLDNYAKGDVGKIIDLYKKTQPKKVPIGSLMGRTELATYLVTSPDGWVPISDCIQKIKRDLYTFTFASGKVITASHDHLYQTPNLDWHYARDLNVGDVLLSEAGEDVIVSITPIYDETKVYDLSVNHPNHRYYTDGICSHNSGKSLFMQNLAVNWAQAGLSGAYITLELSEGLCSMRIDSMMTETSSREIFKDIDNVEMKVKMIAKKAGKLRIKYMPAQSTVNDIRAYCKELQIQTGIKVEFLCVDYLDLLMPVSAKVSPSDLFVKDKYVSEELRNLAKELNVLFVTASQLNRCLTTDTLVEVNGQKIRIDNIKVGDYLLSNEGPVEVTEILPTVIQPVYEITLKSGKKIKCSAKHKFPTLDGIKTLESGLKIGDKMHVLRRSD